MTSFWEGDPTFPAKITFNFGNEAVKIILNADGTFDGDPKAMRAAMERSRGGESHPVILAWLLLRAMEDKA
jgi:hypothetical protein